MYTSGELERASMAMDEPMKALSHRIMSDIVRRIRENGEITSAADWQINRLVQLGMGMAEIQAAIDEALGETENISAVLFKNVIKQGYVRDKKLYKAVDKVQIPFDDNAPLQQLISAVTAQTNETMHNITQSLGFAQRGADGRLSFTPMAKYYQETMDKAMLDISSGAFDYNTVLKRTVREMTNSGLRTVDYATGWSNRVEVASRRAVMTGMTQLTAQVNEQAAEDLETDWFEISWHGGARPDHWWGGKWYQKEQLKTICKLGDVTGLCGVNCRHSYSPVIPGISEPMYTEEELTELNRQENEPVEYNGKKYTKYEALQRQRRLETTMRAQREEMALLKEGGDSEDDLINCRARYMVTSNQYAEFSKAMGLPQQRERVFADGLGNIMQGKTEGGSGKESPVKVPPVGAKVTDKVTAEERKELLSQNKVDIHKKPLDNDDKDDIIKEIVDELSQRDYRYGTADDYSRMSKVHNKNISKADAEQIKAHTKEDGSPGGYVATHNYSNINSNMRGDGYSTNPLDSDDLKTIEAMRNAIAANVLDDDYTLVRYVNGSYLTDVFSIFDSDGRILQDWDITHNIGNQAPRILTEMKAKIGTVINEKAFVSTSIVQSKNIMTDKAVRFELKAPTGTNAYVTKNKKESECILGGDKNGLDMYINNIRYSELTHQIIIEAFVL